MNWKYKAHALAILSRIPGSRYWYQAARRIRGNNPFDADREIRKALELVNLTRESGRSLRDADVLEIGTGERPFVPCMLRLAGAARINTLDITPWLSRRQVLDTYRELRTRIPSIAHHLQLDLADVESRFPKDVDERASGKMLLRRFQIDYHCPADARNTGLDAESVDVVVSSNVLEHLTPKTLSQTHVESRRVLKPDGIVAHRFNPEDHFADTDWTITGANCLRYTARQWYWYGGSGLAYHNRLRCIQHREMMEQAGLHTLISRVRTNHRALRAIQTGALKVAPEFARFTPEQLASDYMWLVGEHTAKPVSGSEQDSRDEFIVQRA